MKHTKGEWNDNGCGGVWRSGKNWKVADVKAGSGSADMRLILSAPELLEALKLCARVLQDEKVDDGYRNTALTSAFSAVRKAEGK